MKISIITPVKDLEKYIGETIESIINQRGNFEIEYLIIDGGSSDKTLKICKDYERKINKKERDILCKSIDFKIISEPDCGMYDALSKGLKLVTGEIVCYLNADDFYLPNAFSCVSDIFTEYKQVKWITGLPLRYNEKGQIINFHVPWQYKNKLILKGYYGKYLPFIQQESVFWRRELNEVINLDRLKSFKLAGDFYMWHSIAKKGFTIFVVDSFLGGNRLRDGQLSYNKEKYYKEFDSIRDQTHLLDYIKMALYWVMEKFGGKTVKRRLSKNRILYKKGRWFLNL